MKIIITVKDTDNIVGLKEDIAMRLEGVTDIVRIDTADVVPRSEVASEIFEEIEKLVVSRKLKSGLFGDLLESDIAELKKKYTEGNNG